MRKWRERFTLKISSFSVYFLPLYPFPISKIVTFCRKMLNTALLSRMLQKSQHTRYEEIILGRSCCEEAPQVVPAWISMICDKNFQCSRPSLVVLQRPNVSRFQLFQQC